MPNADRSNASSLDHALDALVTGTPEHGHASDRTFDPATSADPADLHRAAHQFHGLAARADQRAEDAATRQTLDTIWENVMDTHVPSVATAAPSKSSISGHRSRRLSPPGRANLPPQVIGWQGALNGVLAAALILAIAAGLWRATNGFGPGGDDDPYLAQLAGMTTQSGTPDASSAGTVDLPTADECTVEPLTVDRVMELVEDPYDLAAQLANLDPNATPPPSVVEPSTYPTQEMLNEIDAVHRQVVACVMAESPFQVWALVSPELIRQDVLGALPVFADEVEVRTYLEQLQTGLTEEQAMVLQATYGAQPDSFIMVDPNPRNSITLPTDETLDVVRVGALVCNEDGGVEQLIPGQADLATNGQSYFEYHYRPSQERWELWSLPGAG